MVLIPKICHHHVGTVITKTANRSCHSMSYVETIKALYAVNTRNPVKMGLENSQKLYDLLGKPLKGTPIIHIGGTNGKGSVSIKVNECLGMAGLKCGLFVSPHISSFRERIQINNCIIDEQDCINNIQYILRLCSTHDIPATFFELTTALALLTFQQRGCEAVVLEVGLGGKLDATNIITPAVSVITSIQLDHCKILGDTIEKIALEKSGIIKPNLPVIIGPDDGNGILAEEARKKGSPLFTYQALLEPFERSYRTESADVDDLNKDLARSVMKLLIHDPSIGQRVKAFEKSEHIHSALQKLPPCRFEMMQISVDGQMVDVVLDIAHNVDAIKSLVNKMRRKFTDRTIRVVVGMCADKEVEENLFHILRITPPEFIHCTEARHPRAMPSRELQLRFMRLSAGGTFAAENSDVKECLNDAIRRSARDLNGGIVLVCGTAFIMSDARVALGIVEPRDGDILYDLLGSNQTAMQESFVSANNT